MKKIVLLLSFLTSCTLIPNPDLSNDLLVSQGVDDQDITLKASAYPVFNAHIRAFSVAQNTPTIGNPPVTPTPEQMHNANRITVAEKLQILELFDLMKFVLNTPEFKEALLKANFTSARNASGAYGSLKVAQPLNMARVYEVLTRSTANINFIKRDMDPGFAALGTVGSSMYVKDLNVHNTINNVSVMFPSRYIWDWSSSYNNLTYGAEFILHEVMHNYGFTHNSASGVIDPTYGIQGVFANVAKSATFRDKYKEQLARFTPFYPVVYNKFLQEDTVPATRTFQTQAQRDHDHDHIALAEEIEHVYGPQGEITEVCIIQNDGTHVVKRMQYGRIIN